MNVRCKFFCSSVTKAYDSYNKRYTYEYKFSAVTSGSEENKQFWQFTPTGSLSVTGVRDDLFAPGQEYFIDIAPALVPGAVEAVTPV